MMDSIAKQLKLAVVLVTCLFVAGSAVFAATGPDVSVAVTNGVTEMSPGGTFIYTLTIVNPLPGGTASVANLVTTSFGTCSSCNPSNPTAPVLNTRKDVSTVNGLAATCHSRA